MNMIKPENISSEATLVNVLSDVAFANEHIKDSINISVYEVAFPDKIAEQFPDKSSEIIVYGQSNETEEAQLAYERLTALGYTNVSILDGGILGCTTILDINSNTVETLPKGDFSLDIENSRIEWVGRNIGNKHNGSMGIKSGSLSVADSISGQVIIDMSVIGNKDVEGDMKKVLEDHLRSDDFFSVDTYPTSTIKLISVKEKDSLGSQPNYDVTAELTIKGITNEISFESYINPKGDDISLSAHFDIDRTKWNVKYGSEVFFAKLGMHIISDFVSFDVILHFKK